MYSFGAPSFYVAVLAMLPKLRFDVNKILIISTLVEVVSLKRNSSRGSTDSSLLIGGCI